MIIENVEGKAPKLKIPLDIYLEIIEILEKVKNYEALIIVYQGAIKTYPNDLRFRQGLAEAYEKLDQQEKVQEILKKEGELNP